MVVQLRICMCTDGDGTSSRVEGVVVVVAWVKDDMGRVVVVLWGEDVAIADDREATARCDVRCELRRINNT